MEETLEEAAERIYREYPNNPLDKPDWRKVYSAPTTKEIEDWLNDQLGVIYDSIKIVCNSVDNSPSGVIFTVVINCA